MIVLDNLSKRFNGNLAVDKINLTVKKGEIVGLLGPNGAGKTTTLRMIAGVLPPSLGRVVIDGLDMKDQGHQVKKMIGFLPENNPLYDDLTVEEHLNFWSDIKNLDREKREEAINFVVAHTGIKEVYYRPISEISKGYRQRVGLSQVLLTKPQILLLDEPTEGLDPNQRRDIKELIHSLGKDRTVIVSSHVLSEIAKICNRIVIIHKGRIVADGSPDELASSHKGAQIIEVEIIGSRVVSKLEKLEGVSKVKEKAGNFFVVESAKNQDVREKIFDLAVSNKWRILTLYKKQAELEDVFSQLTEG